MPASKKVSFISSATTGKRANLNEPNNDQVLNKLANKLSNSEKIRLLKKKDKK
jgi:hypothetical protein